MTGCTQRVPQHVVIVSSNLCVEKGVRKFLSNPAALGFPRWLCYISIRLITVATLLPAQEAGEEELLYTADSNLSPVGID